MLLLMANLQWLMIQSALLPSSFFFSAKTASSSREVDAGACSFFSTSSFFNIVKRRGLFCATLLLLTILFLASPRRSHRIQFHHDNDQVALAATVGVVVDARHGVRTDVEIRHPTAVQYRPQGAFVCFFSFGCRGRRRCRRRSVIWWPVPSSLLA